jgi:multicomponent Na+:H+ antiporter subunit G
MTVAVVNIFMWVGAIFLLLASMGLLRMPDLYTRMQVATKATTLGVTCCVLAAALWFQTWSALGRAALIITFIVLTTPIGAHILCRMAYLTGIPLWKRSVLDEFAKNAAEQKKVA